MKSSSEDSELIHKVLNGEHHFFDALVLRYERLVFGSALTFLRNHQSAEDVTQEVFLAAYRRLASFEGRSSFGTWLRKITFHQCIDFKRRLQARPASSLDDSAGSMADTQIGTPAEIAEGNELVVKVRGAIELLAEEQRHIILLREIQGLEYADIAEILAIPVGTVRSRLHRARLELKDILQSNGLIAQTSANAGIKTPGGLI